MKSQTPKRVSIAVDTERQVSGLLQVPVNARACYVLAHGAGAGMEHPFMVSIAEGLAERHVATLRYQFPYMERGGKRPDSPALAQATVRAAIAAASRLLPNVVLIAGGKSFGGRMTSQAQAASPLASVHGLAFLGFPLHAAGKPSDERAQHLFEVQVPMLFLQGSRDALADLRYLRPVINRLGQRATLKVFEDADHSFHVRKSSGRNDSEIRAEMLDALAHWIAGVTEC
jgi:predicted alpha/beta-hydrolase family hydrolase